MLVIDEAKAAHELLAVAKELVAIHNPDPAEDRMERLRPYLLGIQDFVFRHRTTRPDTVVEVTGKEIEDLKWKVGRALDLT